MQKTTNKKSMHESEQSMMGLCVSKNNTHKTAANESVHEKEQSDEFGVDTCCPKLPHWSVAAAAAGPFAAELLG